MDVYSNKNKVEFINNGVIKYPNFLDTFLCKKMVDYLEIHESEIIKRFKDRKRFLSTEIYKNKEYIKYFEFPLEENAELFGKAVNSKMFEISKNFLNCDVRLKSVEIHSRFPGCSPIPKHQDNAYYGLNLGKALTFYIALNPQEYYNGGLVYIKNNIEKEYEHKSCKTSGFSLVISDKEKISNQEIKYKFLSGDCSIHHSRSIHFASAVPENTERGWVLRTSLYAEKDELRPKHKDWYLKMIESNRLSKD